MSIQFGNFKILFIGILLTVLIYGGRLLLSRIFISKETPNSEAAMISFIIPKGLAAAVLGRSPHAHELTYRNRRNIYRNSSGSLYGDFIQYSAHLIPYIQSGNRIHPEDFMNDIFQNPTKKQVGVRNFEPLSVNYI